jgi:hypothetical protein
MYLAPQDLIKATRGNNIWDAVDAPAAVAVAATAIVAAMFAAGPVNLADQITMLPCFTLV